MLENLHILMPNRLILRRNNSRCLTAPLIIKNDALQIIESNDKIFKSWFKEWLISYVPKLIKKPKWFVTERNLCVGDALISVSALLAQQ